MAEKELYTQADYELDIHKLAFRATRLLDTSAKEQSEKFIDTFNRFSNAHYAAPPEVQELTQETLEFLSQYI